MPNRKKTVLDQQDTYKQARQLHQEQQFVRSNTLIDTILAEARPVIDKLKGDVLMLRGENNFAIGNYKESLNDCIEAERIFKELKLIPELSEVANNTGAVYNRLGLLAHALFKQLEALTYCFQTGDDYSMARTLFNAAVSFFDSAHMDKAMQTMDTVLLICERYPGEVRYEQIRVMIYHNKTTYGYILMNKFEEGLALLLRARDIAVKYSFSDKIPYIESNIAQCLMKLDRYEEAYQLLGSMLQKSGEIHDDLYVVDLAKMALIYRDHFHDEAKFLETFDRCVKMAEEKGLIARQIRLNEILKDHYENKGNEKQAEKIAQKLKELNELNNPNKQITGLDQLFDTNLLAVENTLKQKREEPEFSRRYDYLIGTYSYTVFGITKHIFLRDIVYIEAKGNYLYIYVRKPGARLVVDEEAHKVRKTMKEFMTEINDSEVFFAQTHKSFIVNLCCIPDAPLKGASSILLEPVEVKISNSFRKEFIEKLNAFYKLEMTLGV